MPKIFQFRAGSVIYCKGDPADRVLILQNGMVNLVYQDMENGADMRDMVQQGEFFGVKSALGRYAREENAICLKDSTIMAFSIPEFEQFAAANTRIVMKMLTVFSTQLRQVHRQLTVLLKTGEQNPEAGLFSVGEYYFKQKRYTYAKYIFNRYLAYYPSGKNSAAVTARLEAAERASGGEGGNQPSSQPAASQPAETAAGAYHNALNLIKDEKYQNAYLAFKQVEEKYPASEWAAKSAFEIGRCLYTLKKFAECIQYYTGMLGRYPQHPNLRETVFFIGRANEHLEKKDRAAAFYKKVLAMPAPEGDKIEAMTKRALKDLGE
ncbi:MAG: cyclic nucleotide-binding domain-containing protein [Treponema sp.]|jgi:TolA-binding protein|nr:cyclic nucleotide-binding domain-containing protein [Treponema sp.]